MIWCRSTSRATHFVAPEGYFASDTELHPRPKMVLASIVAIRR